MLKTFWTGIGGWADQQLADSTIVWTAPSGKTYKTLPGSRLFFPAWNTTTTQLPQRDTPPARVTNRGVMMPKRRRTRAADRAQRIKHERALNAADRAHWAQQAAEAAQNAAVRNKPPPPPTGHEQTVDIWDIKPDNDIDDDPPPF